MRSSPIYCIAGNFHEVPNFSNLLYELIFRIFYLHIHWYGLQKKTVKNLNFKFGELLFSWFLEPCKYSESKNLAKFSYYMVLQVNSNWHAGQYKGNSHLYTIGKWVNHIKWVSGFVYSVFYNRIDKNSIAKVKSVFFIL